jgi:CubicO group peptidase (beta-lactamase class C family)
MEEAKRKLQLLVDGLVAKKPVRQAILAVESGDGTFQWAGAVGENTSGAALQPDNPYFIASIDKMFNAVIIFLLHEQGKLDLEAPISQYLPETITRGLHSLNGVDYSSQVTIRHLLSHTSGLAEWLEDAPKGGKSLIEQALEKGDQELSMEEIANFVREQLKPHFPPQNPVAKRPKVRYCDTNYALLIAIIEAVTGEALHRVQQEMLYKPLDMRHTYSPGLSEALEPVSAPPPLRADGQIIHVPLLMRSARGIYSTTHDTITFLRSLVRNQIFQNPVSLQAMLGRWKRFGFPTDKASLRAPSWPIEYGMGAMRFEYPRWMTPFNPIPAVIGHTGSTGSWLFWCRELDVFLSGSVDEVSAGAIPYRVAPETIKILQRTLR